MSNIANGTCNEGISVWGWMIVPGDDGTPLLVKGTGRDAIGGIDTALVVIQRRICFGSFFIVVGICFCICFYFY